VPDSLTPERLLVIDPLKQYFLIRTSSEQISFGPEVRDAHAREGILAVRWWSVDEIGTTSVQIFPADLSELLRDLTWT
jgi:hypothetical protein